MSDDRQNKMDSLIAEMTKWSEIAKSSDPILELEIRKSLDFLRDEAKVPATEVAALEKMLRNPRELAWKLLPPLPDEPLKWTPADFQIRWFRDFIAQAKDGMMWKVPSTGQVYKIDKVNKTFTLVLDTEDDHDRWHDRNKMILGLLGWKMIDNKSSAQSFSATDGNWVIGVFDFSIAEQKNPKTGENFPPGSRGQDAIATQGKTATFARLGHVIAAYLWKFTQPQGDPEAFGSGKTNAAWLKIKEKHGNDSKQ